MRRTCRDCGLPRTKKNEDLFVPERAWCKRCRKAYRHKYHVEYYRKNRDREIARLVPLVRKRRQKRVDWLNKQIKDKPCTDCRHVFSPWQMDFDHRDGTKKVGDVSDLVARMVPLEVLKAEIAKCDLVCANCHRERTHKRQMLTSGKSAHS